MAATLTTIVTSTQSKRSFTYFEKKRHRYNHRPICNINNKLDHRVYDRYSLSRLFAADNEFSVAAKKNFTVMMQINGKGAARTLQTG